MLRCLYWHLCRIVIKWNNFAEYKVGMHGKTPLILSNNAMNVVKYMYLHCLHMIESNIALSIYCPLLWLIPSCVFFIQVTARQPKIINQPNYQERGVVCSHNQSKAIHTQIFSTPWLGDIGVHTLDFWIVNMRHYKNYQCCYIYIYIYMIDMSILSDDSATHNYINVIILVML